MVGEFHKVVLLPASCHFLPLFGGGDCLPDGKNSIFINATGFTGALTSIMRQGAQMIVLAGLLLGGLIVAQTLGIKGAEGSMKLAAKMGEGARSMAGRKALQYGSYALRRKGEKPDSKSAAEWLVDKAKSVKIPL